MVVNQDRQVEGKGTGLYIHISLPIAESEPIVCKVYSGALQEYYFQTIGGCSATPQQTLLRRINGEYATCHFGTASHHPPRCFIHLFIHSFPPAPLGSRYLYSMFEVVRYLSEE
jgi:hypothetical protein